MPRNKEQFDILQVGTIEAVDRAKEDGGGVEVRLLGWELQGPDLHVLTSCDAERPSCAVVETRDAFDLHGYTLDELEALASAVNG